MWQEKKINKEKEKKRKNGSLGIYWSSVFDTFGIIKNILTR
jgi:hypothetical protein